MSVRRDNRGEDGAGRENLGDGPSLLANYDDLDELNIGSLWITANKIEPWEPKSTSMPALWPQAELHKHDLHPVALLKPEKAEI